VAPFLARRRQRLRRVGDRALRGLSRGCGGVASGQTRQVRVSHVDFQHRPVGRIAEVTAGNSRRAARARVPAPHRRRAHERGHAAGPTRAARGRRRQLLARTRARDKPSAPSSRPEALPRGRCEGSGARPRAGGRVRAHVVGRLLARPIVRPGASARSRNARRRRAATDGDPRVDEAAERDAELAADDLLKLGAIVVDERGDVPLERRRRRGLGHGSLRRARCSFAPSRGQHRGHHAIARIARVAFSLGSTMRFPRGAEPVNGPGGIEPATLGSKVGSTRCNELRETETCCI
jgi:hypothetical protein